MYLIATSKRDQLIFILLSIYMATLIKDEFLLFSHWMDHLLAMEICCYGNVSGIGEIDVFLISFCHVLKYTHFFKVRYCIFSL